MGCLFAKPPDPTHLFGTGIKLIRCEHLMGTGLVYGGNPERDSMYFNVAPRKNDVITVDGLNSKYVPVDGFWSISVYNAQGCHQADTGKRLRSQ
jgi:hypothetical protein